ncbi:MAG: hypothetical protein R3B09_09910 [Nannocystaceae bacterium]
MPSTSDVLTPEARRAVADAADRILVDLRAAVAHGPGRPPGRVGRFAARLEAVDGKLRDRLKARVGRATPAAPSRPPAAGTLHLPPALRERLRTGSRGAATVQAMKLGIAELRCVDDTRAVGADRMAIGLLQTTVDTTKDPLELETRVVRSTSLGKFRRGDREVWQPPKVLDTVPLSHPGRAVTTTFVLAEEDLGGFDLLLRDLADEVSIEVVGALVEGFLQLQGGIAGATFLGTLGGILGPAGAAAGITLGFAIGVAVGEGVYRALHGLVQLVSDDLLDPITRTLDIPEAHAGPRSTAPLADYRLVFTGAGGKYEGHFLWIE